MTNEIDAKARAEEEQRRAIEALRAGKARYLERVQRAADAGAPLPSGGVVEISPRTIYLDSCAEVQLAIANELHLHPAAVELLFPNPGGAPEVRVGVPRGYMGGGSEKLRGMVEQHIQGVIRVLLGRWEQAMEARFAAFGWAPGKRVDDDAKKEG